MSADVLRRAAALMRSRAEVATAGPWIVSDDPDYQVGYSRGAGAFDATPMARVTGYGATQYPWDAEHIASWDPTVALAVADWLDTAGADIWAHGPLCECGTGCDACDDNLWEPHARAALALARAYLGESA